MNRHKIGDRVVYNGTDKGTVVNVKSDSVTVKWDNSRRRSHHHSKVRSTTDPAPFEYPSVAIEVPDHSYDSAYLPKRRIQLTPEDVAIFAMHSSIVPTSKYIAMDHIDAAIMAKPDRLSTLSKENAS